MKIILVLHKYSFWVYKYAIKALSVKKVKPPHCHYNRCNVLKVMATTCGASLGDSGIRGRLYLYSPAVLIISKVQYYIRKPVHNINNMILILFFI